jgi:hypothetical protein
MRFLFVNQNFSKQAAELLVELAVDDVSIIVVLARSDGPTANELALLVKHPGAQAAACDVNRGYRKCAAKYVTFCCEPKKFRIEDQPLREWLSPPSRSLVSYVSPSKAFFDAASREPTLLIAPNALDSADELAELRWKFTQRSADFLAKYAAAADQAGAPQDWKAKHGVDFAPNGGVSFKYTCHCNCDSARHQGRTEWHLKEGDRTARESAARIYFVRVNCTTGARVAVLFVGPHPTEKEHTISFTF